MCAHVVRYFPLSGKIYLLIALLAAEPLASGAADGK
jgi:hypothetical protein